MHGCITFRQFYSTLILYCDAWTSAISTLRPFSAALNPKQASKKDAAESEETVAEHLDDLVVLRALPLGFRELAAFVIIRRRRIGFWTPLLYVYVS